ncbi:heavy-metal-associated domain-containing protein [bacterium]|nr:heavy-metal-associated domain-containing protein [bacterium]
MTIPRYSIPILTIVLLFAGYFLRFAFTQPTTSVEFGETGKAKLVCIVDGVKCKGTANYFTNMFNGVEGISSIETIATEHIATFTYDPTKINREQIRKIIEQPILLRDGSSRQFFSCVKMK